MTNEQQSRRQRSLPMASLPGFSGLGFRHLYIRLIAVALLLVIGGMVAGMVLERSMLRGDTGDSAAYPDLEAVSRIINEDYYYRPTDPEEMQELDRRMEQHAIMAALGALGDQYTRYLSADQAATAQEDLQGHYGGVGVDLGLADGLIAVTNVIPDSPADHAGIVRGDILQQVDSQPVDVHDFEGTVRRLRGEVGAPISVSLARPSTGERYTVEMTLEEITIPPVTLRMIEGTSVGWIRITIFGDETVRELDAALGTLDEQGATGIILDLRGNGGGWVTSAQAVLGRFLPADLGPALYEDSTPGRGGEEDLPILSPEGGAPTDLPVIVLVDGGTASAAEIVAGAMKDYDRALVIGQQTHGKGSVQRIFGFSDGASLRVTVAEWFTPSRGRIQDEGIHPNIEVEPEDEAPVEDDPVLETALRLLQEGMTRPTDLVATPAGADSEVATPAP